MWAVANGVPRNALNCPILDAYLQNIGGNPAPNRHDLGYDYLRQLNELVSREHTRLLKGTQSVSMFSDGWRDLAKRDWLDLGFAWTDDSSGSPWTIDTIDADLIYVAGAGTGNNIETLLKESAENAVLLTVFPVYFVLISL